MSNKGLSLIFLLLMFFIASSVYAQEYFDVIKTKDGSLYKGVIIENIIDVSVKIELAGGSIITIPYENLLSIGKEKNEAAMIRKNQRPISFMGTFRTQIDSSPIAFFSKAQFAWGYFHLNTYLGVGSYSYYSYSYNTTRWDVDESVIFAGVVVTGLGLGPYFPLGKWGAITVAAGADIGYAPELYRLLFQGYANVGLMIYFYGSNEDKKAFSMELNAGALYSLTNDAATPYISVGFGYSYYRAPPTYLISFLA